MSTKRNLDVNFMGGMLPELIMSQIYCMMVGTVSKYDSGNQAADVQPAPLQSDDSKRPVVTECPVLLSSLMVFDEKGRAIYKPLKAGDKVLLGFHDRDLENYRGQKSYKLATRRMHSINDGIVLGRF